MIWLDHRIRKLWILTFPLGALVLISAGSYLAAWGVSGFWVGHPSSSNAADFRFRDAYTLRRRAHFGARPLFFRRLVAFGFAEAFWELLLVTQATFRNLGGFLATSFAPPTPATRARTGVQDGARKTNVAMMWGLVMRV